MRECPLFSILSWRHDEKNVDDVFLLGGLNEIAMCLFYTERINQNNAKNHHA